MSLKVTGYIGSIELLSVEKYGTYYKITVQTKEENKKFLTGWTSNSELMHQLKINKIQGKI